LIATALRFTTHTNSCSWLNLIVAGFFFRQAQPTSIEKKVASLPSVVDLQAAIKKLSRLRTKRLTRKAILRGPGQT